MLHNWINAIIFCYFIRLILHVFTCCITKCLYFRFSQVIRIQIILSHGGWKNNNNNFRMLSLESIAKHHQRQKYRVFFVFITSYTGRHHMNMKLKWAHNWNKSIFCYMLRYHWKHTFTYIQNFNYSLIAFSCNLCFCFKSREKRMRITDVRKSFHNIWLSFRARASTRTLLRKIGSLPNFFCNFHHIRWFFCLIFFVFALWFVVFSFSTVTWIIFKIRQWKKNHRAKEEK